MKNIKCLLFDWGDTLMVDYPQCKGAMVTWEQVSPMPGVIETMPKLASHFSCAVASNAVESNADLMNQAFKRINLDSYFSLFITSKELGVNKPSPNFFTGIATRLKIPIEHICMIGNDYQKDIVGAKNVGMKTILVTQCGSDYSDADNVITSFEKLIEVLL